MDPQNLRHLHGLRDFIRNLVEQAERSGGCECHRPPSLLLVGPPGAGKTYLVKQMSNVCDMPLFGIHTHQLSGPTSLRNMFSHARDIDYPSLFFLDDIEHIFSDHDDPDGNCGELAESLRRELYKQLGPRKLKIFDPDSKKNPVREPLPTTPSPKDNGCHQEEEHPDNNGLILVAATSSPWLLYKDHELLSRFRGVYLVGLPDRETRYHLLKHLMQKVQHNLTEKDFWVVADKLEGYTPSDILMIAKSLNYEQFAFLLSMAGASYDGESSDEESMSDSDITETDMDSNCDKGEDVFIKLNPKTEAKVEGHSQNEDTPKSSRNRSLSSTEEGDKNTTLGVIEQDWSSSSDETEIKKTEEKSPETKNISPEETKDKKTEKLSNATGATADATDTGSVEESKEDTKKTPPPSPPPPPPDSVKTIVPDNCDSSSKIENSDVNADEESHPEVKKTSSVSEVASVTSDNRVTSVESPPSDDETKEFELRIFQPADPFRNDNQAIDSGSDSDNEAGENYVKRNRRVNFCNVPSMHPLSVDVDDSNNINPNISLAYEPSVSLSSGLDDSLLSKDPYCGPTADTILKRLLSSSSSLHEEMEDVNMNSKNARNKDMSILSKDVNYHDRNYLNSYSNTEPNSITIDQTDSSHLRKEGKNEDLQTFPRSPTNRRSSLSEDGHSLTGVSPQLTGVSPQLTGVSSQLTGVSPQLTGVSPQLTPTGSDSSSNLATDNSSESGSGRRIRVNTPTADNERNKSRDSNSSIYEKSDTATIPSSDTSSAACNASGETLVCRSDSEEHLRNLEDDLKNRRTTPSSPSEDEEDDEDELSGEESRNQAIRRIFNLNNLGEVGIKILNLNDVLSVISRTPRSVSDEKIKQYTDFMVWFANVAKSACPHTSKGAMSDTASSADVSVSSSLWSQSPSTKKRKGPLKKLGRFLLKALMFILD